MLSVSEWFFIKDSFHFLDNEYKNAKGPNFNLNKILLKLNWLLSLSIKKIQKLQLCYSLFITQAFIKCLLCSRHSPKCSLSMSLHSGEERGRFVCILCCVSFLHTEKQHDLWDRELISSQENVNSNSDQHAGCVTNMGKSLNVSVAPGNSKILSLQRRWSAKVKNVYSPGVSFIVSKETYKVGGEGLREG